MPRTRNRIYRRTDSPYWWAEWTDHEGRHHRQSTGCRDHGAATAWLATRELERVRAGAGIAVTRSRSLAAAAADYLAEKEPLLAPKWWGTVEGFFRLQVLPHFGPAQVVSEIGPAQIAEFRAAQIGRKVVRRREERQVSPSTVNRLFWAMAAFGAWCQERGYHQSNPWSVESLPESQLPVPALDGTQLARVLVALPARWRPLVEFAGQTGMRKGELGRLAWQDLDLEERRAWVVSAHGRGLTKSRRTRSVPLSLRAVEILEGVPRRPDGLVFGPVGDPRRAFKSAAAAAGLDRVWLHLFRHLAASALAARGASTADLVAFGGWSSSRMADRYSHTHHRRLLAVLDGKASHAPRTPKKKAPVKGA